MEYLNFQKKVIKKLKSDSLKNAIAKEHTVFSTIELLKIICEYVEQYDDRRSLLKEMQAVVNDVQMLSYIGFLIDDMEKQLSDFKTGNTECIYELYIKNTPDSYEERYICATFDAALNMIDAFYAAYKCKENIASRYKIVKRRILDDCTESFSEDFRGSYTLNAERKICGFYPYKSNNFYECDGLCFACNRMCMENVNIKFPAFTGYKDLVRYYDHDGSVKYGVSWDEAEYQGEECYIIPLDCFALRYHHFDNAHDFHEHIPYPCVENADEYGMTEKELSIYREYISWLEKSV